MVIAMTAARMVEMTADDVVDVVSVRDRDVSAARTVSMSLVVAGAGMARCARRGIANPDGQRVLVDVVTVDVMHVAVVQIVLVTVVRDRRMSAALAVLVIVIGMGLMGSHGLAPSTLHQSLK